MALLVAHEIGPTHRYLVHGDISSSRSASSQWIGLFPEPTGRTLLNLWQTMTVDIFAHLGSGI